MIKINEIPLGAKETVHSAAKERSIVNNPFVDEMGCQALEATYDGKAVGSVTVLPFQLKIHGKIYHVCGGSALRVEPKFRGKGIAARLTLYRMRLSKDEVAIAAGLSGMSLPLFRKLGFATFTFPRLILLKRGRPVVEMLFQGMALTCVSKVFDVFLDIHRRILRFVSLWNNKQYKIREVDRANEEIIQIIDRDIHPFRENHTKEWFDWVLHYPFVDDKRSKQHLYLIEDMDENCLAFFLTKERFHQQASHRGFRNVILGSVIEWGILPDCQLTEQAILRTAAVSFGKHVDAVEICVNSKATIRNLKYAGFIQVGESNMAVKSSERSPLAVYEQEYINAENWRIRPAFSDNSLS